MEILAVLALVVVAVFFFSKKAEGSASRPNPSKYDDIIAQYADQNDLRFALVKGVIRDESNFSPLIIGDKTLVNKAYGLMQIRQPALTDYNRYHGTNLTLNNLLDPRANIMVGSWYLAQFIADHGESVGLEMYNVGHDGYENGHRNPAYVAKIQKFASSYA